MESADNHHRCPMCGSPTAVASAETTARRSQGVCDALYNRLNRYRVCQSCSLLFKVSYLDTALRRLLLKNRTTSALSLSARKSHDHGWSQSEIDQCGNIRPGSPEQLPPTPVLPSHISQQTGSQFHLRLDNSRLGLHLNIEVNGSQLWSGLTSCVNAALQAISQAIDTIVSVQQTGEKLQQQPKPNLGRLIPENEITNSQENETKSPSIPPSSSDCSIRNDSAASE